MRSTKVTVDGKTYVLRNTNNLSEEEIKERIRKIQSKKVNG